MSLKIWMDGKLLDKADAKVSVYDHGLLYGDGVFEGIRVYHGKIFECEAHLKRLYDSAKAIRLEIPFSPDELRTAMNETFKANNFKDCYIRLVVTRGVGHLGISPANCERPSVFIIADLIQMYPKEMYEQGMAVIVASVIRSHPNALSPRVKSLNYLNSILAKLEALDAKVPEAVMLNHNGNVAECTADNIFIVTNGELVTPPVTDGALAGITRGAIMKLATKVSIPAFERTIQRYDLYTADECFLTGTGAEIVPVTRIDGRLIGNGEVGKVTRKLSDAFHKMVREV